MNRYPVRVLICCVVFLAAGCTPTSSGRPEVILRAAAQPEVPPGGSPLGLYVDTPSEIRTAYWRFEESSYRINAGEDLKGALVRELRRRGFRIVPLESDPETTAYPETLAGAVTLRVPPPKTENEPPTLLLQAPVRVYDSRRRKLAEFDLRTRVSRPVEGPLEKHLRGIWQSAYNDMIERFTGSWDMLIASGPEVGLVTAWGIPQGVRFRPGDPNQLENTTAMDSLNPIILKMREFKNIGLLIEVHVFPEPPPPAGKGQKPPEALGPEALAVGRGGALRRYVSEWGIGADRITVKVRDREVPLVPPDTPASHQVNNRIDFVLVR